jgi:hypothetical protein
LSQINSNLVYPVTAIGIKGFPPEVGRRNAENAQNSLSPAGGMLGMINTHWFLKKIL